MFRTNLDKGIALAALGILLGIASVSVTILGLKPDEWPEKIESWLVLLRAFGDDSLAHKWKLVLVCICGAILGFLFRRKRGLNVLSAGEFGRKFQALFSENDIRTLQIFGYTYETVRDYQKYEHLYQEGLDIQVLNRCWMAEKTDEDVHNGRIEGLGLRRWRKSETIRQSAQAPWTYKARREIRYYNFSHPIIKGAILKSKNSTWAFVNFYKWEELPPTGGSQFKGGDLGMIFLDGSRQEEKSKIEALASQFELVWKYRSYRLDQVHRDYKSYMTNNERQLAFKYDPLKS